MTSTVGGCGTPPEKGGLTGAVTFLSVRSALGCFHMEMIGLRLPRHFNSRCNKEWTPFCTLHLPYFLLAVWGLTSSCTFPSEPLSISSLTGALAGFAVCVTLFTSVVKDA